MPTGTFWSACLSPDGEIDGGSPAATYDYESFAEANDGINPSAWAWNGSASNPQYWGIQNAYYLWEKVLGNNSQPTQLSADQATGFALAIWSALYDSTAYGMLGGSQFNPNFSSGNVDSAVQTAYNDDLALLNDSASAIENNLVNGYVLVPTSQTQNGDPYGQEFIFMAPQTPVATVPESAGTGIWAGLGCLILSLGYCLRRPASVLV